VSTERPLRSDGVDIHEVDDGLVVYDTATDRVHYLNESATVIFELCNGERTTDQIAELVRAAWELDTPPSEAVAECLERLLTEQVVR
jgi:hypothetical protein